MKSLIKSNVYTISLFLFLQRIIYMTNVSTAGMSEIQDVEAVYQVFQIGFQGVYTG